MRLDRQRVDHPRDRSPIRRTNGQVLRQRLRARYHLQLPKGILYSGRTPAGGRDAGKQQEECFAVHKSTGQLRRHGGEFVALMLCPSLPAHARGQAGKAPVRLASQL